MVTMPGLSERMERIKLSQSKVSLSEVQIIKLSPGLSRHQEKLELSTHTEATRKCEGRCEALSQDNSLKLDDSLEG